MHCVDAALPMDGFFPRVKTEHKFARSYLSRLRAETEIAAYGSKEKKNNGKTKKIRCTCTEKRKAEGYFPRRSA
jgi:hypothetical protein